MWTVGWSNVILPTEQGRLTSSKIFTCSWSSSPIDLCANHSNGHVRREFLILAIGRQSVIHPTDDSCDSARWYGETGSNTLSRWSTHCNFGRHWVDAEMFIPIVYYWNRFSSYHLSRYVWAFGGLGNVFPPTTLQNRQIPPALGKDASISWIRLIQQAISPGDAMEC